MDAPPNKENCDIFLHAAKIFHEIGVNVPKIIDKNMSNGFILRPSHKRFTINWSFVLLLVN